MSFSSFLLAAVLGAALPHAAAAVPLAYSSNEGSASVSVIDTGTDKVVATFKIGERPRGIAISLDGARLYLSDQTTNSLIVVDTAKRTEIARAKLGDSPEAIYLSNDGRFLSAAIEENNQVLILDTTTLAPVKSIRMRGK